MDKKCGVLLPVFSLPSKYGIGTFGVWAYKFVDLLKETGHTYWQVLPLVQTGYSDSPYSSCSDISGNPYFIDPEILRDEKLLTYREVEKIIDKSEKIDYGKLYATRYDVLRKAFSRFDVENKAFRSFLKRGEFNDYALYMALKQRFNLPWYEWVDEYKLRDEASLKAFEKENKNEILFWQFVQFEFERQYRALKKYANSKGIKIIGDLPFYVAYDSVDVWVNPKDFRLDENYRPSVVAGVPPDYFSKTGQLWGNPVYDYDKMRADGFKFWKNRVDHARKLYDLVRIDHFRAFDKFWAVPYGEETAINGKWETGGGAELLHAIGTEGLFTEDLGLIDDSVRQLIKSSGLMGMKVLLFAFDGDENNPYLPWNVAENSIIYTGTHDNNTIIGSLKALGKEELEKQKAKISSSLKYLNIYKTLNGVYKIADAILDIAYASESAITIIPMQDILGLDGEFRTNLPGSIGCWRTRIKESLIFTDNVSTLMKRRAKRFLRA